MVLEGCWYVVPYLSPLILALLFELLFHESGELTVSKHKISPKPVKDSRILRKEARTGPSNLGNVSRDLRWGNRMRASVLLCNLLCILFTFELLDGINGQRNANGIRDMK